MSTVSEKMTALADEARTLSGTTDKKSIDEIIEDVTDANEEITDQSALISQILDAVNNLPEAKGDNCIDVTDITRGESDVIVDEGQVNVDAGYYPSRVIKEIESVEQATPSITVSSTGLITAKSVQNEGYVLGGTKQATKQLTTQEGKKIIPSKSLQTAVPSGVYTTGAVTVAEIPDEYIVPSGTINITDNGTYDVTSYASATINIAGSGGGGSSVKTCTVTIKILSGMVDPIAHYVTVEDGKPSITSAYGIGGYVGGVFIGHEIVMQNVMCESMIYIEESGWMLPLSFNIEGTAKVCENSSANAFILAPTVEGENCTITFSD